MHVQKLTKTGSDGMFINVIPVILICLIFILIYIKKSNMIRHLKERADVLDKLLNTLKIEEGLESSLNNILFIVNSIIQAPSFALFLMDNKSNSLILRAVRHAVNDNEQIGPAYSGLLPYKKETFLMPTSIPADIIADRTKIIKEGEVPLLLMPIKGEKAIILIGPIKYVPKTTIKLLDDLSKRIGYILELVIKAEELKNQVKVVASSERAVKNVSNLFFDVKGMLDIIMRISARALNASGGLFINNEGGPLAVETVIGLDKPTEDLIYSDTKTLLLFDSIIGKNGFVSLNKNNKEFFQIPPYFIASDVEVILMVKVDTDRGKGIAVFWYDKNSEVEEYQVTALQIMGKRMADIINNHLRFKELSGSYVEILKTLARLLDNTSPFTVGYSELMSRYSLIIAKEMKLSPREIKDISLAAYLSNIGIIGLSDKILHKKGKYSEIEYEMMKFHADAGASIIEATLGNQEMASYIRYHHERVDGYGYPEGLIDEEIPIGARIICVVQMFLAKIMGRDYRSALHFDKAIEQLRAASETQLDENVVNALIGWLDRKQQEFKNSRRSLGYCWDMRCTPENVCVSCPAYKNTKSNCWDIRGVNCAAHGSLECENCFVYTEYIGRVKKRV
jgi:HD-GYP domain-containing protein (c-di-GMP phosphodiesterase class II)